MSCPNTNLPEYISLAASRGDDVAYALWDFYEGNVPESEYRITNFKILDNAQSLNLTETQVKDIYNNYVNLMDRKREGKSINLEQFKNVLKNLQVFEHNGTYIFGEWDVKNNIFKGRLMSSPNIRQLFNSLDVLFNNANFMASVPSDIGAMLEKKGLYKLDVGKAYNFKGEDMVKNLYFSSKELVKKIFKTEPENVTVEQVKKYDEFFNYRKLISDLKTAYELKENDKLFSILKNLGIYDYNAYKLVKKIKQGKVTEEDAIDVIQQIIKNSSNNKVNIDKTDLVNHPKIYNELNTELNKILASYLSKFGIKTELLEDLQDNLGIDSYATVDILNKIIYADKNNQEDYPQQAGKLIAFMMQHNPLVSEIMNAMKRQSMFKNLSKDELFEAVGDLISQELHKKTNTALPETLINSIKNLIRQFLNFLNSNKLNRINKNIGIITENILIQNQSLITQSTFKPGAPGKKLVKVSFQEALNKDKFATAIVDKMANDFILGGSISFAEQGPVLRPDENQVHDLDWASPHSRKNSKKIFEDLYPEGQRVYIREIHDKESDEWTDTWLLCEDGHTIKNLELSKDGKNKVIGYDIVNNKTNEVVSQYIPRTDSHTGEVVAKPIDIFSSEEGAKEKYPTQNFVTSLGTKVKLGNWRSSFAAKLRYGRLKDIWDYNRFIPEEQLFKKETNNNQSISFQKAVMPASRASEETLNKLKEVATKMGVKMQALSDYLKGNPDVQATDINALADLFQGIIAIAEGKEDVATIEEIIHVATAMIEQVEPKMITEMISKITRFKIYQKTLDAYKLDPNYQLPNGKPDIRKIKKEAVDKLISELVIKQSEGSTEFPELLDETNRSMIRNWWNTILDWFRGMYKATNINVFEQAATKIAAGDIGARYYNEVKPGVEELFNDNPELADIGTQEQYSAYIDSIFPDSQVKDIVYHGSDTTFDGFLEDNLNYFGTQAIAKGYGKNLYPVVIEINKPYYEDGGNLSNQSYEDLYDKLDESSSDGFISNGKNLFVPKTEQQVHILGNKQDIEGFKSFMETAPAEFKGEGVYFQKLSPAQVEIQKRIQNTKDSIEKKEEPKSVKADPLLMDTEEASNYYVFKNPDGTETRIVKRVTDRVKAWYRQRFRDRTFSEAEKEFNEFKRTLGVKYHHFYEEIHGRYFNSDGTRKTKVGVRPRIIDSTDEEVYDKLEQYYVDLIAKFSQKGKNPLVFSEVILYDPKEKEAGTIDLLIVEENGRANIFDWKFMSVSGNANDIPWYKQGAYNVQLGRYKDMLKDAYGVKEFGMNRAIPILMEFRQKITKNKENKLTLSGIAIGTIDSNKIEDMRLVPVSEESESTGSEDLDNLLSQLNSIYKQISKSDATSDEEREYKKERLNVLKEAIRAAHATQNITPLINVIKVMRKEGQDIINDWETIYDKKVASSDDFDNPDLSDYSDNIREYLAIANVFVNVDKLIGNLIWNKDMEAGAKTSGAKKNLEYRKKVLQDINEETKEIFKSVEQVKKIAGSFANKFVGERNLVTGLLKTDAIWKGLGSFFRGASEAPLASIKILYKLVNNAKGRASADALEEINELLSIRAKLAERGGDLRQLVKQIYQKNDDNKLVNKLIYKYQKEFYDEVDNNAVEGRQDKNWLMKNIDIDAYKKEALTKMNESIDRIAKTHEDNPDMMDRLIEQERNKWNIASRDFNGWNNYIIKRHPKDKWLSQEYLELQKDPELFQLYNFINKINSKANDVGYIQNKLYSTFLPFVRKSMAESIAWDFSLSSIMKMGDDLSVRASDVGYGSVNELTGELEHSIPKYYTQDFSIQKDKDGNVITDEKGKTINDYSDVSEDLFKNMILYISHMEKYKYLSEVEGQIQLVKTVESFKGHLNTSLTGDIIYVNGKPQEERGNDDNEKIFDNFLRALLYEQKYPLSDYDTALNVSPKNAVKKAINKLAGKEVYAIDEDPSAISLVKSMDTLNRSFQLKTLGFEVISGAVNLFGANIQLATQAGNYFKAREVANNEKNLIGNRFKNDDEREMFVQLIDVFMPLKDDPSYEKMKASGMSALTRQDFSDMLMYFMREPEHHVEKSVFLTLLDNSMIVDGRIINIREFVKNKYKDRYASAQEYRSNSKDIEAEIEELKKTKSITNTKQLVDGKLVVPGLDLKNYKEVERLKNLTRYISRQATGGMSDSDLNRAGMSIWSKSMMVFKGWIPKLVDTRFGEFRKVGDDFSVIIDENGLTTGEKYDIGRVRLFASFLSFNIIKTITDINDIIQVNENGVLQLDAMYEKFSEDYKKRTGENLNMSREDFMDLIRTNLRNQVKELTILLAMVGIMFSVGFMAPDDDEDKATKNFFRYSQKVIDKFVGELSFFYNPVEFQKMLSGSTFPALGLFSDIEKFITHFTMEITGLDLSDKDKTPEEVRKNAQPIKYAAKMLPITKSFITYAAIFSDEFAKDFDITIENKSNR